MPCGQKPKHGGKKEKQKQCNKFSEDFRSGSHKKKKKTEKKDWLFVLSSHHIDPPSETIRDTKRQAAESP